MYALRGIRDDVVQPLLERSVPLVVWNGAPVREDVGQDSRVASRDKLSEPGIARVE